MVNVFFMLKKIVVKKKKIKDNPPFQLHTNLRKGREKKW